MTTALLLSTILFPLIGASTARRRFGSWAATIAPLPAIVAAVTLPSMEFVKFDWIMLGIRLGMDDTGRLFLLASAVMWTASAVYAAQTMAGSTHAVRFYTCFQLAMAGNFALILAQDMATFYLGFTLMGLSAYALVAHDSSASARRAGRVYISWTVLGEVILFCALVLIAASAGGLDFDAATSSAPSAYTVALLVLGFGIKLALPGLHFWLPYTYSAAPIAGAAVLSGPMISAGFLGWIRFLPPGTEALSSWGELLVIIGITQAMLGTILGLVQTDPRAVLGYSSIAKMGVLTAGFGVTLAAPEASLALIAVLALYAVHHLLVKSALFLGVGFLERGVAPSVTFTLLVVLGLALAGAPLSSGALAKTLVSDALPQAWPSLYWLLAASGAGSTLLMARFLYLEWRVSQRKFTSAAIAWAVWSLLVLAVLMAPFALAEVQALIQGWEAVLPAAIAAAGFWKLRPTLLSHTIERFAGVGAGPLVHRLALRRIGSRHEKLLPKLSEYCKALCAKLTETGSPTLRRWHSYWRLALHWPLAGVVWLTVFSLLYLTLFGVLPQGD